MTVTRVGPIGQPISVGLNQTVTNETLCLLPDGYDEAIHLASEAHDFVQDTLERIARGDSPLRPAPAYSVRVVVEALDKAPPAGGA
jgi:hypothetical protein